MAVLGPGQKPIVMPHYPHMLPADRTIWTAFLEANVVEIDEVWYDLHVGSGVELPFDADPLTRQIRDGITRKRIDVVCRLGSTYWVVEVKERAGMYALGQVITYVRLFKVEYAMTVDVIPVIVCFETDEDIKYMLQEFGVLVYQRGKV